MCWRRCANASQIHLFKIHSSFIHTSNFGSTKGIWSGREKTPAVQLFFSSSSLYWESAYFSLSSQSTLNSHQRPSHWGTLCKQEAWATVLRQKVNTDAIAPEWRVLRQQGRSRLWEWEIQLNTFFESPWLHSWVLNLSSRNPLSWIIPAVRRLSGSKFYSSSTTFPGLKYRQVKDAFKSSSVPPGNKILLNWRPKLYSKSKN